MSIKKSRNYIFKNGQEGKDYLTKLAILITEELKEIPRFSNYKELDKIAKPLEDRINNILSEYKGVVGSDGFYSKGTGIIDYFTKMSKIMDSHIPVDITIWVPTKLGYVTAVISNCTREVNIKKELSYPNYLSLSRVELINLERAQENINNKFYLGKVSKHPNVYVTYFSGTLEFNFTEANTETPEEFLASIK